MMATMALLLPTFWGRRSYLYPDVPLGGTDTANLKTARIYLLWGNDDFPDLEPAANALNVHESSDDGNTSSGIAAMGFADILIASSCRC